MYKFLRRIFVFIFLIGFAFALFLFTNRPNTYNELNKTTPNNTINDVTGMNPTAVLEFVQPKTVEEIQNIFRTSLKAVSIGGGRFSMGGQISAANTIHLDLREMDKILALNVPEKTITVQPGVTWRQIQEYIDPYNLSVSIMQSYANFTVGGSLSVNVHGRYIGFGPLVGSVEKIKLVLPSGELIEASHNQHPDIFGAAVGGYGGIGVIVEATLRLASNTKVKRSLTKLPITNYLEYFRNNIRDSKDVIFQNGDLIPPYYDTVYSTAWKETNDDVTVPERLYKQNQQSVVDQIFKFIIQRLPGGVYLRRFLEPLRYLGNVVEWRNYEAGYDVSDLAPISGDGWSYVLQEYFVPVNNLLPFVDSLRSILNTHNVQMVNVSIRHANKDDGSLLAWAREEVFAFVLYYRQDTDENSRRKVELWTRELINAATSLGGAYYLPYQLHATKAQFLKAYPQAGEYFSIKQKFDPDYRMRNQLWDAYYKLTDERKIFETTASLENYFRPEEQTFLTLLEWDLVFASENLARQVATGRQSNFPFFGEIKQFWTLYANVFWQTKLRSSISGPINWGYHFMNVVIGTTTTIEYALKGIYENSIGRLSELIGNVHDTPSPKSIDGLIAETYSSYANFIHNRAWYEYPFLVTFNILWSKEFTKDYGNFRHIERKLSFSFELLCKAALSKLFSSGTVAVYGAEDSNLKAVIKGDASNFENQTNEIKVISTIDNNLQLVSFPRYEKFTEFIKKLTAQVDSPSINFLEIAGNKEIVVTVISPINWQVDNDYKVYEWQTTKDQKRVAIKLPVSKTFEYLREVSLKGVILEHVFDY